MGGCRSAGAIMTSDCNMCHFRGGMAICHNSGNSLHTHIGYAVCFEKDMPRNGLPTTGLPDTSRTGSRSGNLDKLRSSVLSSVDTHLSNLYFAVSLARSHCLRHFLTRPWNCCLSWPLAVLARVVICSHAVEAVPAAKAPCRSAVVGNRAAS